MREARTGEPVARSARRLEISVAVPTQRDAQAHHSRVRDRHPERRRSPARALAPPARRASNSRGGCCASLASCHPGCLPSWGPRSRLRSSGERWASGGSGSSTRIGQSASHVSFAAGTAASRTISTRAPARSSSSRESHTRWRANSARAPRTPSPASPHKHSACRCLLEPRPALTWRRSVARRRRRRAQKSQGTNRRGVRVR